MDATSSRQNRFIPQKPSIPNRGVGDENTKSKSSYKNRLSLDSKCPTSDHNNPIPPPNQTKPALLTNNKESKKENKNKNKRK